MQTQPTRRTAMFRAVAGVAAIGVASCAAQPALAASVPSTTAWDAAMAEQEHTLHLANLAGWENDEAEAQHAAWRVLMETPAPHVAALHWKLNYLFGPTPGFTATECCDSWSNEIIGLVLADSARLAAQEG